jgi:hypothetical protein
VVTRRNSSPRLTIGEFARENLADRAGALARREFDQLIGNIETNALNSWNGFEFSFGKTDVC